MSDSDTELSSSDSDITIGRPQKTLADFDLEEFLPELRQEKNKNKQEIVKN